MFDHTIKKIPGFRELNISGKNPVESPPRRHMATLINTDTNLPKVLEDEGRGMSNKFRSGENRFPCSLLYPGDTFRGRSKIKRFFFP